MNNKGTSQHCTYVLSSKSLGPNKRRRRKKEEARRKLKYNTDAFFGLFGQCTG